MPTTVHIPPQLLKAVDRRAAALKVSRNRYIVRTLQSSVEQSTEWSDRLWETLSGASSEDAAAADDMLAAIKQARASSKKPPF
jgi:metal-responsive CopG/Arc/MetJ family transcriptional regulator